MMQLSEQFLELISVFKEQVCALNKFFTVTRQTKNSKSFCACAEGIPLILKALKFIHLATQSL
jgi:hypothetical protein